MLIQVGLENNTEGRSLAWALDFPGCFAYGADGAEALLKMPRAVLQYAAWIASHTPDSWLADLGDFDVRLVDTWDCFGMDEKYEVVPLDDAYEVNAWFRQDWKPLTEVEITRGLALLNWSRSDLLASVAGLSPEQLNQMRPGERWSINGILNHVGGAEWWYLDRLDLTGSLRREQLSQVPAERLAMSRALLKEVLPTLLGVQRVLGKEGEFWSPRKLLRRAVWHELDHVEHIRKLIF